MLTLLREIFSWSMTSSIDKADPVMYSNPWTSAMVGLTPQSELICRHRPTNSCSTASIVRCRSAFAAFMGFIPFRKR